MPVADRLLSPPLGINAPINDLERLWLETSCYYAVFDDNAMEDTLWDQMAVELWERREELSPYFCHAVNLPWPAPQGEPGENPLKTAMSVNWERRACPLSWWRGSRRKALSGWPCGSPA